MGADAPIPPVAIPAAAPAGALPLAAFITIFPNWSLPAVPCKGRIGAESTQRYPPSMRFSSFWC